MNFSILAKPQKDKTELPTRLYDALSAELGAQHGRFILWSPAFLALGIGLYFGLDTEPPRELWRTGLLLAALLFVCGFAVRRRSFLLAPVLWGLCSGSALVLTGASLTQMHTERLATIQIGHAIGPVKIAGTVGGIERLAQGEGARILLENIVVTDTRYRNEPLPQKARLRLRYEDGIRAGDRIEALAKLLPTARPVSPDSYDYQRDLYFRGIGASGFVYGHATLLERRTPSGISERLERVRQTITQRVSATLPPAQAGVVATLLTGEGSTISKEDWDALRGSGLAHLLAISGMNVALVAGFVFFAVRLVLAAIPFLALRIPIKKVAALCAFVATLAYTALVGAQVPVVRALLMTGVGLFAITIDRSPFSLRLLALAAFVILAISPQALLGASFQMSFAAVGALIFVYDAMRERLSALYRHAGFFRKALLYLGGICVTSLLATIATAPFSLFNFQTLALYGAGANLIGVPLMSFLIMPAAMLTYMLMPLSLEGWTLEIMRTGVAWTLSTAHATAALPGAVLSVPIWPQSALGLLVLGAVVLALWRGAGRMAGLIPIGLAVVLIARTDAPTLLVSETGGLVAFRDESGILHPSSRRAERFTFENWMRQSGQNPTTPVSIWPKEGRESGPGYVLTCEPAGCHLHLKNKAIAIVRHESTLAQDCAWADVVISSVPVRKNTCRSPHIMDRFDVWRKGAHAAFLNEETGAVKIDTVSAHRGQRPWVKAPERKQELSPRVSEQ